jgi:hypothetical protein
MHIETVTAPIDNSVASLQEAQSSEEKATKVGPKKLFCGMSVDHLYHIGFHSGEDLPSMFGDVTVVLLAGSTDRIKTYAHSLAKAFPHTVPYGAEPVNIARSDRYGCGFVL